MKFRKKPVVIDAVRWDGRNETSSEMRALFGSSEIRVIDSYPPKMSIRTLEGNMTAQPGDWIIRGVSGELYPYKPDIFALTYEPAELGEHSCIWCPVEVRDLHACAHNAVVNYGTDREQKKMAGLAEAVNRYQPELDAHFAADKRSK